LANCNFFDINFTGNMTDNPKPKNFIELGDHWLDKSTQIHTSLRQDKGEQIFGGFHKETGAKVAVRLVFGNFKENIHATNEKLWQYEELNSISGHLPLLEYILKDNMMILVMPFLTAPVYRLNEFIKLKPKDLYQHFTIHSKINLVLNLITGFLDNIQFGFLHNDFDLKNHMLSVIPSP
jgi:hypothetical protein